MKSILFFLTFSLMLFSCEEKPVAVKKKKSWSRDHSVSYNQEINERERIKIALFLEHHQEYKMQTTETGLRYVIYQHKDSNFPLAKPEQKGLIKVKIYLLDGTLCYETEDGKVDEIVIDRNQKESGLNEALMLMTVGDKAKLILPNHLAHGLVGDQDKIPPLAILFMDVELIELQ